MIYIPRSCNLRHTFFEVTTIFLTQTNHVMKKQITLEKKAGIWIDQQDAFIIRPVENNTPSIQHIKSEVESRIRTKGE